MQSSYGLPKIPLDTNVTSYPTFDSMESTYTVKQLAKLAGVSVRTLHHYDQLGLLEPSKRTTAGYRLYGESELLRLQQIMFYKELDLSLEKIAEILDDPDFGVLQALENHKHALEERRKRLSILLETIDKTILKLQGGPAMLTNEELYEGFPKGNTYRDEAITKWGKETVEDGENKLRKLPKAELNKLKDEFEHIRTDLGKLMHLDVADRRVQTVIQRHFELIQQFWGDSVHDRPEAYKGLAKLYVDDERYTQAADGKADPDYALFISKAMVWYVGHIGR